MSAKIKTIEEASEQGMHLKLSAHTIVLQDENGKMRGMLKGFKTLDDYRQSRSVWKLFDKMKQMGIQLMDIAQSVIFDDDDTPYLLIDDHWAEVELKLDPEGTQAENQFYRELEEKGIRVLHFPNIFNARPRLRLPSKGE
jgi:oligoribonuclease NrnB/cAMP/cGMP phosphodiesterase (DHH superfamily)